MVEQVSDFKETCSASPPAAVLVVMAVGIEPRLPAYKPCLLTTRLLWLTWYSLFTVYLQLYDSFSCEWTTHLIHSLVALS